MMVRLQRALLPAVLLGMQACWVYAWASFVEMAATGRNVVAPVVILYLAAGSVAGTYAGRLRRRVARRVSFWLLWAILAAIAGKLLLYPALPWDQTEWLYALPLAAARLIFETRPAELLLLLGSGLAWYAGGRTVERRPSHEMLLSHFQFGLVMLLGAFLLAYGLHLPSSYAVLLALAFFGLSLSGVALTRSRQAGARVSAPANRQFAGSLASLVAVVSLLGLLAGIAVTPDLVGMLISAGRFVLGVIVAILACLISLLPDPDLSSGIPVEPPASGDDLGLLEFYRSLPLPEMLRRIARLFFNVVFFGMMLFALWRICSAALTWLRRLGHPAGFEVESLDTGLLADVTALFLWLTRQPEKLLRRVTALVRRWMGAPEAATWNAVYAEMLRWAGRKLRPRAMSESAHEYQTVLSALIPAASPDLALVTETYARARYGGYEPDGEALADMRQAVQRIRHAPRPRRR